jgi:hypothetical protein
VALTCWTAPQLSAQPVVSTTVIWDGSTAFPLLSRDASSSSVGQTFTVPSGAVALNGLTVFLGYAPFYFPDDLTLRVQAYLFDWNTSTSTLGNLLWTSAAQDGAMDVPLEARVFSVGGIPVVAGNQYAFVLSTLQADPFDAAGLAGSSIAAYQNVGLVDLDSYAGGALIQSVQSDWATLLAERWLTEPDADLAFELRFAPREVGVVPEPSTVLLLVPAAVLLLALTVRRRATFRTLR